MWFGAILAVALLAGYGITKYFDGAIAISPIPSEATAQPAAAPRAASAAAISVSASSDLTSPPSGGSASIENVVAPPMASTDTVISAPIAASEVPVRAAIAAEAPIATISNHKPQGKDARSDRDRGVPVKPKVMASKGASSKTTVGTDSDADLLAAMLPHLSHLKQQPLGPGSPALEKRCGRLSGEAALECRAKFCNGREGSDAACPAAAASAP